MDCGLPVPFTVVFPSSWSLRASLLPLFLCLSLACLLPLGLTGCSLSTTAAPSPDVGLAISGTVHGGQNPIVGAQVYLFAANAGVFTPNASGYGNASLSLLTAGTGRTLDLKRRGDEWRLLRDHGPQRQLQHYG